MSSGIELYKEALAAAGLTKTQCESKTAEVALQVLSQSEDVNKYFEAREAVRELEYTLQRENKKLMELKREQERLQTTIEELRNTYSDEDSKAHKEWYGVFEETKQYMDKFFKALEETETPGGRDRLKVAQMFVNSVSPETKYDNTAYIIALGAICSGENMGAINTLRKINPKLFENAEPWEKPKKVFYERI